MALRTDDNPHDTSAPYAEAFSPTEAQERVVKGAELDVVMKTDSDQGHLRQLTLSYAAAHSRRG